MNFKVSDVVVLKSGGPDMTVLDVLTNGQLVCRWTKTDGSNETALFHPYTRGGARRESKRSRSLC